MNITGGVILYAMLWFLVMFVLLPIGQRSQADAGEVMPGTPAGAPHEPALRRKALLTTLVATLLWIAIALVIFKGGITRADIAGWDQVFRR